jgi:hypothetical protein
MTANYTCDHCGDAIDEKPPCTLGIVWKIGDADYKKLYHLHYGECLTSVRDTFEKAVPESDGRLLDALA